VFLTTVGGGAFGNRVAWIAAAIAVALRQYRGAPLDVHLVFYRSAIPQARSHRGLVAPCTSIPCHVPSMLQVVKLTACSHCFGWAVVPTAY